MWEKRRQCRQPWARVLASLIARMVSAARGSCITITRLRLLSAGCLTRGGYYSALRALRAAAAKGWALDRTGGKRPRIVICRVPSSPLWCTDEVKLEGVLEELYDEWKRMR